MKDKNKVILSFPKAPEPNAWTFSDFCYEDGTNLIEEWLEGQGDEVDFSFNTLLKQLHTVKNHLEWTAFRCFLQGKYKEERIWELGFKAAGRQYRILGRFDGKMQTILFCGCYHKQGVYTPADALETAYKRAKLLSQGKARLRVRQIQTDI